MKIILPWPHKHLNPNSRKHWTQKAKATREYRDECYWETISQVVQPNKFKKHIIDWEGTIHVIVEFYPPDKRRRDDDNVFASFKAGRDGIADALSVNDRRFRMHPVLSDETVKGGKVIVLICSDKNFADITNRTMGV